jgi:hypothetical protein
MVLPTNRLIDRNMAQNFPRPLLRIFDSIELPFSSPGISFLFILPKWIYATKELAVLHPVKPHLLVLASYYYNQKLYSGASSESTIKRWL